MKYIMMRIDGQVARELPIIFPDEMVHSYMLEAVRSMRCQLENRIFRPYALATAVSAGEITVNGNCFGGSETLGVKSRGNVDSNIVNTFDYMKGMIL